MSVQEFNSGLLSCHDKMQVWNYLYNHGREIVATRDEIDACWNRATSLSESFAEAEDGGIPAYTHS